jgi:hypothetical protein
VTTTTEKPEKVVVLKDFDKVANAIAKASSETWRLSYQKLQILV